MTFTSRYTAVYWLFLAFIGLHYLYLLKSTNNTSNQLKPHSNDEDVGLVVAPDSRPIAPHQGDSISSLNGRRANATFFMLCRNNELKGVLSSIQQVEDRFNKRYGYPWVLLNDEPFTDEFKTRVSVLTDSRVSYGLISSEHWQQPSWIDEEKAKKNRQKMRAGTKVPYADSVSYRNMCRYNSGFFYHHPLMLPYRFYWRVEPSVHFFCDIHYDPFLWMQDNNKLYGFTISMTEIPDTITTLWDSVREFIDINPRYLAPNNSMSFISDDRGATYNLCHYWSNFEIADMSLWRSEAYEEFFLYLEMKGGFYYERWGDAPVHSIAASLFANRDQIHAFKEIGYQHSWFATCPQNQKVWQQGHCNCDQNKVIDYADNSCLRKYELEVAIQH